MQNLRRPSFSRLCKPKVSHLGKRASLKATPQAPLLPHPSAGPALTSKAPWGPLCMLPEPHPCQAGPPTISALTRAHQSLPCEALQALSHRQAGPGELRTRCPHSLGIPHPTTAAPLMACFPLSGGRGRLILTSRPTKSDHPGEPGSFEDSQAWHPSKQHVLSSPYPKRRPYGFLVVSTPPDLWELSPRCLGLRAGAHCPSLEGTRFAPWPPSFHFLGLVMAMAMCRLCVSSSVEVTSHIQRMPKHVYTF